MLRDLLPEKRLHSSWRLILMEFNGTNFAATMLFSSDP
jgi:hypothetical protein